MNDDQPRVRANDYKSVTIMIASPDDIRSWSSGEVTKPETINYRTHKPEKEGLFCERIFGPERDWECFCGKYKGIKHKGVVCDRCGVKLTRARERRERMGHINLACPIVHIWFFRSLPNRLATLLGIAPKAIERVVYYQDYVVTDPGTTPLSHKQVLTEDEYRSAREKYEKGFKADMGAEAMRNLLKQININELVGTIKSQLAATKSEQKKKQLAKQLRLVEHVRQSGAKPDWIVLDVIPVIPPDLRPLVLLESGNFATSDLNDLYRRVINRNNRLKKLLELRAPEVIIRNEKRMLQQVMDALFDNSRCKRPIMGSSNRQLKSLTDMISGKQGRFRENLLGKRVDYSARSVIVVGPDLKLHQCGLPKYIALELFQPFIIRRLKELGLADTIKSARKILDRKEEKLWDILEDVIKNHPVLLNRAPTLHRMGIQAFEPILVEGNAIKIHPLVCAGFNADFDGDTMSVHLPLTIEAQAEARILMMSTRNILSPAHGKPIIGPSQDIVLGLYYLTVGCVGEPGEGKVFSDTTEALRAHADGKVGTHAEIGVRIPDRQVVDDEGKEQKGIIRTTPGRIIFNDLLSNDMPFFNMVLKKTELNEIVHDCYESLGAAAAIDLLDKIKVLGFRSVTKSGLSFATSDLKIPENKTKILQEAEKSVAEIEKEYQQGVITAGERHNQILDAWTHATEILGEELMRVLGSDTRDGKPYLNPVYLMASSGARGGVAQLRQLAGMRGLMARPSGEIIETPIRANFREGLTVLDYFSSTHGARKGLADTALKTADSGYLTRKLVDVAQNVVLREDDCATMNGITKSVSRFDESSGLGLKDVITGRTARDTIVDVVTDEVVVEENQLITPAIAERIQGMGFEKVRVRSALTCESSAGICARCYGMDLSTGRLGELGLAVGIIAAQSIGEPGTQLTMRTFHIGGTASRALQESELTAGESGVVGFRNMNMVVNAEGKSVLLNRGAEIVILDHKDRELETQECPMGAEVRVVEGDAVKKGTVLVEWDPHMVPILTEKAGIVRFDDIVLGETVSEEYDKGSKVTRLVVVEHKGVLHPQLVIEGADGTKLSVYPIPEKAVIETKDGQQVMAGTMLAKTPREIIGTQDITGGLPRVTELFEARKPKDPAVMSEIDGVVELGERKRGKMTVIVKSESDMEVEHLVPRGKHMRVVSGDRVKAGEPLVDGLLVVQDILRINGEEVLQQYLIREIQSVYRSQNVTIDDKHIEIIVRQMIASVQIVDPGDTNLLPDDVVDKIAFKRENEEAIGNNGRPASAEPVLLGITKSALSSDSWISAASFQQTTKVLTEAALAGKTDTLQGLKESVILGRLVPVGTGFRRYWEADVKMPGLEALLGSGDAKKAEEETV